MGMFDRFIKGTYQAKVKCSNCKKEGYAELIKGQPLDSIESRPCKNCGCMGLELVA